MKYLITLSVAGLITGLSLHIFFRNTYKYASIQDEVDAPLDYFKGGEKNDWARIKYFKEILW